MEYSPNAEALLFGLIQFQKKFKGSKSLLLRLRNYGIMYAYIMHMQVVLSRCLFYMYSYF